LIDVHSANDIRNPDDVRELANPLFSMSVVLWALHFSWYGVSDQKEFRHWQHKVPVYPSVMGMVLISMDGEIQEFIQESAFESKKEADRDVIWQSRSEVQQMSQRSDRCLNRSVGIMVKY
jgi:hypothetical protein